MNDVCMLTLNTEIKSSINIKSNTKIKLNMEPHMNIAIPRNVMNNLFVAFICLTVLILTFSVANSEANVKTRIVSTDAGATEILLALGLGDSIVGVDVTSTVPEGLKPAVVGYHRNLSAEGLMSLKPTNVFGSEHIGPKEAVDALKQAKTQVLLQPTASNPSELISNIRGLSHSLGLSAESLIQQVHESEESLSEMAESTQPKKIVFLLYLEGRGMQQAGKGTTGDALITLLNSQNQADFSNYRAVAPEALLAMQPDVILVASESPDAPEALLQQNPIFSHTPAGKASKVLFVDARSIVSGISLSAMKESLRFSRQ